MTRGVIQRINRSILPLVSQSLHLLYLFAYSHSQLLTVCSRLHGHQSPSSWRITRSKYNTNEDSLHDNETKGKARNSIEEHTFHFGSRSFQNTRLIHFKSFDFMVNESKYSLKRRRYNLARCISAKYARAYIQLGVRDWNTRATLCKNKVPATSSQQILHPTQFPQSLTLSRQMRAIRIFHAFLFQRGVKIQQDVVLKAVESRRKLFVVEHIKSMSALRRIDEQTFGLSSRNCYESGNVMHILRLLRIWRFSVLGVHPEYVYLDNGVVLLKLQRVRKVDWNFLIQFFVGGKVTLRIVPILY